MFEKLRSIVGEGGFSIASEDLLTYSRDSSFFQETPICVVRPTSTEEVSEVLKVAHTEGVPIIPRGAGTNPCGEVVGKAIILDLSRMNQIVEINSKDMYTVVQPGVVRDVLNNALIDFSLFFPPDPASSKVATLGGMVANNSSGLHAVKYGTTKDYVLALEVVLSDGRVIEIGSLALKSSSGYDLKRLFTGSEGTLGAITKITLRLLPIPEQRMTLIFPLKDVDEIKEIQKKVLSLNPAAFEFLDEICLKVISKTYGHQFGKARAILVVEFSGNKTEVELRLNELKKSVHGELEVPDIWNIRKGLVPLLATYSSRRPTAITEDLGLPISELPEAIKKIKRIYRDAGFEVALYGHLGDGNLHMRVFGETTPKLMAAADEVYSYVISIDGAISSEHGIGRLRAKYMEQAQGNALELMKKVKKTFDGAGILNPGCIF
jgi:glycolate oxidase subunit GlcD